MTGDLATTLPLQSVGPFGGLLASIALAPMINATFWRRHYGKIALFWALLTAVPFVALYRADAAVAILHVYLADYMPFIILLWGLYVVTGGIVLRGTLVGTPAINTLVLAVGSLMASFIGTTGASILLIRPLLRAIANRQSQAHTVIFFIFLVSNIGGTLTPLGDPPLFLGFLHGVPFTWPLRLAPEWAFTTAVLLSMYYVLDRHFYLHEPPEFHRAVKSPIKNRLRLYGGFNFLFLVGIAGSVLLSGVWKPGLQLRVGAAHLALQDAVRDLAILFIGLMSLRLTPWRYRVRNRFTWEAFREVAVLFAGIFMTITPPLLILSAGENGALGFLIRLCDSPMSYFWATGSLSAFLDNTPTYLAFFSSALGKLGLTEPLISEALRTSPDQWHLLHGNPAALHTFEEALKGITTGAVFMGAMTYIGNAPNLMIKTIAEERGVRMPQFLGYMAWSIGLLVPIFLLMNLLFY